MNKKSKFIKSWEGHWSILTCSYFGRNRSKFLRQYGVKLKNSLITIQRGFATGYLDEYETKMMVKKFERKLLKNPKEALKWSNRMRVLTNEINKFIQDNKNNTLNHENYNIFSALITEFSAVSFLVKNVLESLPRKEKEIFSKIKSARLYSENVYYEAERFMEKAAKKMEKGSKIKSELLLSFTDEEFKKYLTGKNVISKNILRKRLKCAVLLMKNSKKINYFGERAKSIINKLNKSVKINIIKGQVAFPGIVRGEVTIIRETKSKKYFKKGSILVTGMTRPDFIPYIKKSKAIITDAGGILSHALIISRELKKPCIIGTKIATKVLHDGDLVEVDADKGMVKILKKAI